jgi:hypothetical protein
MEAGSGRATAAISGWYARNANPAAAAKTRPATVHKAIRLILKRLPPQPDSPTKAIHQHIASVLGLHLPRRLDR